MQVVNVSSLKNNPTDALRKAHEDMVLVMNRDRPDALIVGLNEDGALAAPGVKAALATVLFREGHLSLARSARLAGMTMSHFAAHVSRLGIAVIQLDAQEAVSDLDTLDQWLASS